jgi:hypothetical protein
MDNILTIVLLTTNIYDVSIFVKLPSLILYNDVMTYKSYDVIFRIYTDVIFYINTNVIIQNMVLV